MKQELIIVFMFIAFVSACASWPSVRSGKEVALEEYKGFERDDNIREYFTGGGFDRSMLIDGAGFGDCD